MKKTTLSIIIPTHNSQSTICNLLLSINNSNFKHFNQIETIIIDDFSQDQTIKNIIKIKKQLKFPLQLVLLKKNLGPAKARNLGVKKAKGKFILFLDSDVILFKNTLNEAYELTQKPIKAFTGIWHYRQLTKTFFPQFKALRDWTYWFVEREKNFRYYLFSTRIAGIEKKLFNKIGGFNVNFREPTVEDIELTYRIEKESKIYFCPKLVVSHEFETFWPIAVKYFKRSRDWVQLYQKRLRFDPVATSKKEASKSITVGLVLIFIVLSFFEHYFIYTALVLLANYAFLEFRFWSFLIKKKGVFFLLKSIPVSIVLYLIINLGALYGLLLSTKKSV